MRLLNVKTLRLEEFQGNEVPRYAILSHTWGKEELSFEEMQNAPDGCIKKAGYAKILRTCQQAETDLLKYVWIDTCCIDKSSSAELSEAINSMFRWYEKAKVCYAFLADVPDVPLPKSRWFTRGWTLQELLAPQKVVFFDSSWSLIGTRAGLREEISRATGIDEGYLRNGDVWNLGFSEFDDTDEQIQTMSIYQASIATRMSWASSRETSRAEDMAYCLLGLFGINMPLIYGEGPRAFLRLQEEIMRQSNDHSIFAWNSPKQLASIGDSDSTPSGGEVLARSPAAFAGCGSIISFPFDSRSSLFNVTNQGVQIRLPISKGEEAYALLQCQYRDDPTTLLAIPVRPLRRDLYARTEGNLVSIDHRTWARWSKKDIFLSLRHQFDTRAVLFPSYGIHVRNVPECVSIKPYGDPFNSSPHRSPNSIMIFLNIWNSGFRWVLRCRWIIPQRESSPTDVEIHLIRIPDGLVHSTPKCIDYISNLQYAPRCAFINGHVLFTNVQLQNIGGRPLFILDIILSSQRRHFLKFRLYQMMFGPLLPIQEVYKTLPASDLVFIICAMILLPLTFLPLISGPGPETDLFPEPEVHILSFALDGGLLSSAVCMILLVLFLARENRPAELLRLRIFHPIIFLTFYCSLEKRTRTICFLLSLLFLSLHRYWNWRTTYPYRENMPDAEILAEVFSNGFPFQLALCVMLAVLYDLMIYSGWPVPISIVAIV